jgi:hypothetical protein
LYLHTCSGGLGTPQKAERPTRKGLRTPSVGRPRLGVGVMLVIIMPTKYRSSRKSGTRSLTQLDNLLLPSSFLRNRLNRLSPRVACSFVHFRFVHNQYHPSTVATMGRRPARCYRYCKNKVCFLPSFLLMFPGQFAFSSSIHAPRQSVADGVYRCSITTNSSIERR